MGLWLLAGLCALSCGACASWQRHLIYFPPVFDGATADALGQRGRLERWRDSSGAAVGWRRLSPVQPSQGQLLVLHGNAGAAVWCSQYADEIGPVAAVDVFIVEYPGYSDRPGAPSERSLETSALQALRALDTNKPIYLLGESLGTGVAAFLAGREPERVSGVILLAPYDSSTAVAQKHMPLLPVGLLLVDRFPAAKFLRTYRGPIAVFVGGRDEVVPARFGRRLYEGYRGPKRLWERPAADHGSIMRQPPEVWREVFGFLRGRD